MAKVRLMPACQCWWNFLHYPGGIDELVKIFEPLKSNKLVCEGLGKIRAKFKNINAPGPIWLINFEDFDDEEEKERLRRDAYERVNAFLDALGIEEFKKG